tara:strand:- start:15 stop:311 length:297 start_codon:yes stop_codon:yes gene_type:complete
MIIDKPTALLSLRPNADFHMVGNTINWLDSVQSQPTDAEIDAEVIRLQDEYDAKQYARSRVTKYPTIGDQLDALYHAGVFPDDMAAQIQAVKEEYPKP